MTQSVVFGLPFTARLTQNFHYYIETLQTSYITHYMKGNIRKSIMGET